MRANHRLGAAATALIVLLGCSNTHSSTSSTSSASSTPSTTGARSADPTASVDSFSAVPGVVQKLAPSVVTVLTASGLGSGVVYRSDGIIVTDAHVVTSPVDLQVAFADGARVPAKVLATDSVVDLAIVQVKRTGLPVAHFATTQPIVGSLAVAIGSPLGFAETVTAGIVSGLHRALPGATPTSPALVDLLQTDAPISPGNSGGALANGAGEVIGINEAYIPPSAGAVALGFATPAETVVDVVKQMLATGRARHAFLGVQPTDVTPQLQQQLGLGPTAGALVLDVVVGSPAQKAGIAPGDLIVAIANTPIASAEDLLAELRHLEPGQTVAVRILRGKKEVTVRVTLSDQPS